MYGQIVCMLTDLKNKKYKKIIRRKPSIRRYNQKGAGKFHLEAWLKFGNNICDHCGNIEESYGYDDANFHENVIPKMKCKVCDKVAGEGYEPEETKYPEGYQV